MTVSTLDDGVTIEGGLGRGEDTLKAGPGPTMGSGTNLRVSSEEKPGSSHGSTSNSAQYDEPPLLNSTASGGPGETDIEIVSYHSDSLDGLPDQHYSD